MLGKTPYYLSHASLQKVIEQFYSNWEQDELTEIIPTIVCQHAGIHRCIYYAVQERKLQLISAYCSHDAQWRKEIAAHKLSIVNIDGHSLEAQVVRTGKPVVINEVKKDLATPLEKWVYQNMTAAAEIPVVSQGKVVGLKTCLYREENKKIEQNELEFLTLLGVMIGCTLHAFSLSKLLSQKTNEIGALNKLSQLITSGKPVSEILPIVARETAKTLRARICIIRIMQGEEMVLGAVVGMEPSELSAKFPAKVGLSGWMVKEKKMLVVKDLTTDPRVDNRVLIFSRKQGLRSFIGSPLYFRDKLVGLIAIYTTTPRYFTTEERELLSHFATEAALAIELAKTS